MQSLLRFGAPETGTSLSDTEGDHGKEFHQDLPHDKPLERDELWGEPMDKGERYFLRPRLTPKIDERLQTEKPLNQVKPLSLGSVNEGDYMETLDISPPPVQESDRHLKKRKIEPNYIEDFEHRNEDVQMKKNITPFGSTVREAENYYGTFWTPVPKDWTGIILTPEEQGISKHAVLMWDDEGLVNGFNIPETHEIRAVVVPLEMKSMVDRTQLNVFSVAVLPYDWIRE